MALYSASPFNLLLPVSAPDVDRGLKFSQAIIEFKSR
jgi:hypothetical protein